MEKINLLKEIIALATKRDKEEEMIHIKYGIKDGISFTDPNTYDYIKADRPERDKLLIYLEAIKKDDLIYIATVMYGGRDYITQYEQDIPDFKTLYKHLSKNDNLIYSIEEKAPLVRYLLAGIKAFGIK